MINTHTHTHTHTNKHIHTHTQIQIAKVFVSPHLFSTPGDLLVTRTRRSDTGLYTCEAINEEGIDMASSYVSVTGE